MSRNAIDKGRKKNGKIQTFNINGKDRNLFAVKGKQESQEDSESVKKRSDDNIQRDTVLSELSNAVFRNPVAVNPEDKYSGFETAEEYLSGRVADKLQTAARVPLSLNF